MSSQRETQKSIVGLLIGVKLVEQGSHRPRLRVDVTLGHSGVCRTENTFSRASEGFGEDLDRDDPRHRSDGSLAEEVFDFDVLLDLSLLYHTVVGLE